MASRGTHQCSLSDEQCDIWHGWERIMDHIVATQLPAAYAQAVDVGILTGTQP